MKREAVNHTKMARFERRLDLRRYEAVGLLELLWHLATKEAPAGNIGKLSDDDIAMAVGWDGDPPALCDALVEAGWLDRHEGYRLIVHDWSQHCEDSVHAKLARAKCLFVDGSSPSFRKLNNKIEKPAAEAALARGQFHMPPGAVGGIIPPQGALQAPDGAPQGALRRPTTPYPSLPCPSMPDEQAPFVSDTKTPLQFPTTIPSWQADETYAPFVAVWREVAVITGKPLIDEDFGDAHFRWGRLDFQQKLQATHGVNERLRLCVWSGATDPQFIPLPGKYLEKEYKRPVVGPKAREPAGKLSNAERMSQEAEEFM